MGARALFGIVATGATAGALGWLFGPNGWFAAPIVLAIVLVGVLSRPAARGAGAGFFVYATLAGSQAAVFLAIAARAIPDSPLTPVILGDRSMLSHALGHVFVQTIYAASYLSARRFGRGYRALSDRVEHASRTEAVREALLEEARAEYRRALRLGQTSGPRTDRRGSDATDVAAAALTDGDTVVDGGTSVDFDWESAAPHDAPRPSPSPSPAAVRSPDAWRAAGRDRMKGVGRLTLLLCAVGAVLLGAIAVERTPLYVAWACIGGIAAAIVVHNRVWSLGPASWWAWTVGAVLSVGPAYSIGLHSGLSGAVASLLFLGGLFREPDRAARTDRRYRVYVGTAVAHGIAFALIAGGALPDLGNVPVHVAGVPLWTVVAQHALLQVIYALAYLGGMRVDRRHAALIAESDELVRRAAQMDARLAAANAEIDRVLGDDADAIFAGQQVGRFRLEKLLGRGGMGDVYDAVDSESGLRAAVKLIRRDRAADPRSLAMFAAEARALSRVRSDRVASVLEVGGIDAEVPFIAMERVEGRTLAVVLQERGRLPLAELRVLVRDVAQGLADVHAAGVFHRDVKPQNVAQTGEGPDVRWKILDFGVAQIHDLVGAARSAVAGTPRYMAPEQALGEAIDARADLYSLCLVIYRALTGRPAYLGWNRLDIARAALTQAAPDPRWFAPVPKQVELVLRVGLAARREDRFAAAAELGAAFEAAFEGRLSIHHRARAEALLAREPWSDPERTELPPETPEPSTHVSPSTSGVV